MKIHATLQQRSWEWFLARAGKVTGSELGNLITDKGQIRKWSTAMPQSYLARKLAEKWRGQPLESFGGNRQTDQGALYEVQARKYFSALLDSDVQEIGGIESDDGRLWCSPDGLIAETGLEIKCPNADTHVAWLLEGRVTPEEHVLQVQLGLYVTGWRDWYFLSYCKDLPHLVVVVEKDEAIADAITGALADFNARFDAAWAKLCDMNGGPPPKREPPKEPVRFTWEQQDDVIP